MNRSLKLSMLIAIALGSTHALAETLGPVHVKSTLSQPLLAEIPINDASPAELQTITVQLASVEDFARAGIVGGRPSVPLTFSVVTSNNQPVIRITSSVPVNDPYLDLLLEVNGGSGGMIIREFAILLDPLKTAPVAAATGSRKAPARSTHTAVRSAAVSARHVAAAAGTEVPSASTGKSKYGPVKSGDTLSGIARDSRLSGVSMNQMLLALKQANPDAFYRDNINTLKRGAILRIPTPAEAQSLAVIAAIAEVQRQNSDWRSGTIGKPTVVADSATRASASSAPTSAGRTASDRLALVSTTEQKGASGPGGKTGGKSDTSADGIRQELQRTQESLSSVQQQSTDLKVRLQDLTEINGKNVKLLSLKDSEIADLEKKLAAARKTAGLPARAAGAASAPAGAAAVAAPAAAASTPVLAAVAAAASTAATPTTAPVAAASAASPVVAASVPAPAAKPASVVITPMPAAPAPLVVAETPWYAQTWAWAAGVIAVIIIVLLALLSRRRRAHSPLPLAPASLADRFVPESHGHDQTDVDQNELLDQLAEHPDDIGLHLELVALYYSRRDVDHFEAAAEAMHAHITDTDQDEWQDVLHMGEDLAPGHPLFDHHAELQPQEVKEARRAFDLDDYASDTPVPKAAPAMPPLPPPTPTPPIKKASEYNFNFDLTTPGNAGAAPADATAPARPAVPDPELRVAPPVKSTTSWDFDQVESGTLGGTLKDAELSSSRVPASDDFNDDPVDTKLDLARAYIDMGDPDGARAMLGEVTKEGSQIQRDIAKRLLETLS